MIRPVEQKDLNGLKEVLDNCELFPSEALDDMIAGYLSGGKPEEYWFTYELEGVVASIGFCAPMELTDGTYNLYAIGIHNDHQRKGIGSQMMHYIEDQLRKEGHRLLIVETSSSDHQIGARNFYNKLNYNLEATIKDFWEEGDDKVIFTKKL